MFNFKIYDVRTWLTDNCNKQISQSKHNQTMKFTQLIEYSKINIVFQNHAENEVR